MRNLLLLLSIILFSHAVSATNTPLTIRGVNGSRQNFKINLQPDSSKKPALPQVLGLDSKVIISTIGDNSLELCPLSSINNGLLIEPVNRTNNTSIPTAFYLKDSAASWSFYTNAKQRLAINGKGEIITGAPLLINNAVSDGVAALRVNGQARIDSSFFLQAASDNTLISLTRSAKSVFVDVTDSISPFTSTPTAWAARFNNQIPVFRIRHPNNVSSSTSPNLSIQKDFKILPYEYGMAIEYNGVVECWVGEWSIHRGDFYNDPEGKGNGWGGVLWVGDDQDGGGIRATARNNLFKGGNVNYGELSVEKFFGTANGDFRFRLPSNKNQFQYVYGGKGSTNVVAKISDKGFFLPIVSSALSITTPEKGQVYFDSSSTQFKGYDGSQWISFSNNTITGNATKSGDGTSLVYTIQHDVDTMPSYYNVQATSSAAANISYISADATNISIYYITAPAAGTNNLSWNWQIKK